MTDQQRTTFDYRARPDDELVQFAQGGENRAFDELVRRYQDKVYRLSYKILRHEDDAAEALQDAFLSAYRGLKNFKAESTFSTWLYRIATNCWLADARKRKEELLGDRDDAVAAEDDGESRDGDSAHGDHAHGAALKLDLERAMAVLSEGERAAIVQCYHNDLTHEEAAYVLDCPVGTVKTHVLRGKQKLKLALAAWAPETN